MPNCHSGLRTVVCWVSLLCLCWALFTPRPLAAYKNLSVNVRPAKSYASHQSQGAVTIAADPYLSEKKIRTAFDVKGLESLGLVPVNIIISNDGPDSLSVNGPTISLLDPWKQSFEALPATEVVAMILHRGRPDTLGPFPQPRRFPWELKRRKHKHAFEMEVDFTRKSLKSRVRPRSTSWGFVFFKLSESKASLTDYKIYIPDIENDKTGEKFLYFDLELK